MNFVEDLLLSSRALIMDGAYGTYLQKYTEGHVENLCVTNPYLVTQLHRDYYNAGADLLISNTFSVNLLNYSRDEALKVVLAATDCLNSAIASSHRDVHLGYDIGSLGKLMYPLGDLTFDEVYLYYKTIFDLVPNNFYDFIYIETQQSLYEAKAAILAAKDSHPDLPIVVSFTYQPDGRLLTGEDVRTVQYFCKTIGVAACGINCSGGPSEVADIIKEVLSYRFLPALIKVNAGIPVSSDAKSIKYTETSSSFVSSLDDLSVFNYASIIGGCCGTDPSFIKSLYNANLQRRLCKDCYTSGFTYNNSSEFRQTQLKTLTSAPDSVLEFKSNQNFLDFLANGVVLSSGSTSLVAYPLQTELVLHRPYVIGEQINPTGKSPSKLALQSALDSHDLSFILDLARSQVSHGAELLDINLGSHYSLYPEVISYLQSHLSIPLVIDYPLSDIPTSDQLHYLTETLRIYNGIPLFNSVSTSNSASIQSLLSYYGAISIYLPMSEGRPDGSVPFHSNIKVVDPLCFSISTNPNSYFDLFLSLTDYHNKSFLTSLGLSNISFKCPDRPSVNLLAFFKLPHLNFAIVNPEQFEPYLKSFRTLQGVLDSPKDLSPLLKSLLDQVSLDSTLPEYLQALDEAISLYNKSQLSLPQLVTVSESIIKSLPVNSSHKATFLIATIRGDLHDLGKNIVSSVLRASGYKVIDLGKNVPASEILKSIDAYHPDFIGLSSLLTTTIPTMSETVSLIKSHYNIPIIIGGAVYSEDLVSSFGADYYAPDAPSTVNYCNTHLSQ